jgi:hypothetical protein
VESSHSAVVSASTPKTPPTPITPPGNNIAQQLEYISYQGGADTVYEIVVNNNITLPPTTITSQGKNITVIIRSDGTMRTIQLKGIGSLFSIDGGITVRLQNIILKGIDDNDRALVTVDGANLIIDTGAQITENNNQGLGSVGGIAIINNGNVSMLGGVVSKNKARGPNSAYPSAGGVFVGSTSTFTKRGGIVYGSGGTNGNYSDGHYDRSGYGHAIYYSRSLERPGRSRNTTLGTSDNISTSSNENWEY